jgi:hypothetical protein
LPTTLPTLDELIGLHADVVAHLLSLSGSGDHVFTGHAELEGGKLLPQFERLLAGWKAQGYEIVATETLWRTVDATRLPRCEVIQGEVPGRSGTLAVQGEAR